MKIYIMIFLFSIILPLKAANPIKFTVGEYPPFTSKDLQGYGLVTQTVKAAFKTQGYEIEIKFYPWKRAYEFARHGEHYNGTFIWYKTPAREKHFLYSDPIMIEAQVLFHLKSLNVEWKEHDDLKKYRLCGVIGYSYGSDIDFLLKAGKLRMDRYPESPQCIKMILKDRADIMIQVKEVGLAEIHAALGDVNSQAFTYHPEPTYANSSFLLLSKSREENKKILEVFNKGLAEIKKNGTYQTLFSTK
ncbi:substrate-binding periplasmic protein [Algicola sagamiensis]|uniref:substrate-binding periplasmic protein n=1 Tax=Algicola sagamiensis TaxID=163869 RepID=UPI00146BF7E4|nr:transporter substrate-binding domain-containing protein [Algicola sagamiensis]